MLSLNVDILSPAACRLRVGVISGPFVLVDRLRFYHAANLVHSPSLPQVSPFANPPLVSFGSPSKDISPTIYCDTIHRDNSWLRHLPSPIKQLSATLSICCVTARCSKHCILNMKTCTTYMHCIHVNDEAPWVTGPTLPARGSATAPATSGRCWGRRWAPRAHPLHSARTLFIAGLCVWSPSWQRILPSHPASALNSDVAIAVPGARPNSRAAGAVTPVPSASPGYYARVPMRAASFSSSVLSPIAR